MSTQRESVGDVAELDSRTPRILKLKRLHPTLHQLPLPVANVMARVDVVRKALQAQLIRIERPRPEPQLAVWFLWSSAGCRWTGQFVVDVSNPDDQTAVDDDQFAIMDELRRSDAIRTKDICSVLRSC